MSPIAIECKLARIGKGLDVPPEVTDPSFLAGIFASNSTDDIQLTVDSSPLKGSPYYKGLDAVQAYYLHDVLSKVTGISPNNALTKVTTIAVIFANSYGSPEHPEEVGAFGLMFDRGFVTDDDPSNAGQFVNQRRIGCAVFLDAINAGRNNNSEDYTKEVCFTTVHELGHVFNRMHDFANSPSFMSISPTVGAPPYSLSGMTFNQPDRKMLGLCSSSPEVWPGGTNFGTGDDQEHYDDPLRQDRYPHGFGLELLIDMQQREFWRFEPIELDLTLRVVPSVVRSFKIPNALDPGYETFEIFVEEPKGEIRKYQSPEHFCVASKFIDIDPTHSFSRDITIFGQSRGYTFRRAGVHRLWVRMTTPGQGTLESNRLDVNVQSFEPSDETVAEASKVLVHPAVASMLYYRFDSTQGSAERKVASFLKERPKIQSAGQIHYVLGRAQVERSKHAKTREQHEALSRSAAQHFVMAADSPSLGDHSRRHIEKIVATHDLARFNTRSKGRKMG
jgi:hypothetical protein